MNRRSLRSIWSLYRKDIRYSLFIVFIALFIYQTWGLPMNVAGGWFGLGNEYITANMDNPDNDRYVYSSYEDIHGEIDDDGGSDDFYLDDPEDAIRPIPGYHGATPLVYILPTIFLYPILFLVVFESLNYSRETSSGSIRTLFKYRVSMREIMISKLGSTLTAGVAIFAMTFMIFFVIALTFGMYVIETAAIGIAVILFLIGNYAFFYSLSAIIMYFRGKGQIAGPMTLMAVGNMVLITLTESVICLFALLLSGINGTDYSRPALANLMYLSPYHFLGRFINFVMLG
ncbi:MAG: hypothetical protein ACMUIG_08240, partial [Thermoplasmatota archaeon]